MAHRYRVCNPNRTIVFKPQQKVIIPDLYKHQEQGEPEPLPRFRADQWGPKQQDFFWKNYYQDLADLLSPQQRKRVRLNIPVQSRQKCVRG